MILVTGGNGFVGKQVVRALLERGQVLRIVHRTGSPSCVDASGRLQVMDCPDLFAASREWWEVALDGVDTVVHLAWYAKPVIYLNSACNLHCLTGTIHLAHAVATSGVRRFVGIGTCAEYDLTPGTLGPDTRLRPQTLYAACKAAVFEVLRQFLPAAGVEFAWCRLFYLYGEGEHPGRLVPYLHQQLAAGLPAELTGGDQVRDFLDVRVAGDMIARAALSKAQGALNVCSGIPVTVRQLAERIADGYGRRDLLHFGTRPDNLFDPPSVVGVPSAVDG